MDVDHVDKNGAGVLIFAISHVMESLRQVGSGDTTRILVRLLASRKVSSQALACAIAFMQGNWLTNTQVAEIEDSGQTLTEAQGVTRLLLPVLRAQSTGERRWCGWCWALTPDRNLPMCTRCREYGYCCDAEGWVDRHRRDDVEQCHPRPPPWQTRAAYLRRGNSYFLRRFQFQQSRIYGGTQMHRDAYGEATFW